MAPPSGLKYNYNELMGDVHVEEEPVLGETATCYTSSEENRNDDDADMVTVEMVDEEEGYGNNEVAKIVYPTKTKPKMPNKSKSAKKKDQVNPYDVYMGRGGLMNRFRNGSLYRTLIVDNFESYQRAFFKREFAIEHIIKPIQKKGGRFFVPTKDLKGWTQGDIVEVIAPKVMQALRDCKKEDGNKAGHIYNTPIRNCPNLSKNKGKSAVSAVKGGKTTSFQKQKTPKSPSSSSASPKKPTKVMASSFNHPSNIIRKRFCFSSPAGSPSPKIPKLHNEFGGVPSSVTAASPGPDAPVSSPFGTGGLFRHNLLLGSSPKDASSSSTMQASALTLPKTENNNTKKVIMINESGHVMNTVHRTTGVCGFYHFLLAHNASAFQRISEEDEGRFVWDHVVSPIQKQGGTIHLCCNSGKVQQEVNHKIIICISKVLRDTEYIEEDCTSPYGQPGGTPTSGRDEKSNTPVVKVAGVGSSENSTGGGGETPICDIITSDPPPTTTHARVVTQDTKEIDSSIQMMSQTPVKQNVEDLEKRKHDIRAFNMVRQEVMSIFQKDTSNTRVECKNLNPSDVKSGTLARLPPPVPLTKPAAGSYNALKAVAAAEQCDPTIFSSGTKSSASKQGIPPPCQSQPIAVFRHDESERLTSFAKDATTESGDDYGVAENAHSMNGANSLVTQSKEKSTPVATRKSSRVAAAAAAAEASAPVVEGRATRRIDTTGAPHATRSKRVAAVASVTPEQMPSAILLSSQRKKVDDVASDEADCEKQQKVAWELRYNELIEYAEKHGNCNVPQRCDENPPLGRFVKINRQYWQRNRQGRKTPLTPEREALLGTRWELSLKWRTIYTHVCIFLTFRWHRLCLEYDSQRRCAAKL
jgi:hypothetical protein